MIDTIASQNIREFPNVKPILMLQQSTLFHVQIHFIHFFLFHLIPTDSNSDCSLVFSLNSLCTEAYVTNIQLYHHFGVDGVVSWVFPSLEKHLKVSRIFIS